MKYRDHIINSPKLNIGTMYLAFLIQIVSSAHYMAFRDKIQILHQLPTKPNRGFDGDRVEHLIIENPLIPICYIMISAFNFSFKSLKPVQLNPQLYCFITSLALFQLTFTEFEFRQ